MSATGTGTAEVLDISAAVESLDGSVIVDNIGSEVTVTLAADVLFAFDRSDLDPRADERLREVNGLLVGVAGRPARIDGYTDSKGSDAYNVGLSQRRADSVAVRLRTLSGASAPAFAVVGHGEADPVAPNTTPDGRDDPEGRALDRRVTITFDPPG